MKLKHRTMIESDVMTPPIKPPYWISRRHMLMEQTAWKEKEVMQLNNQPVNLHKYVESVARPRECERCLSRVDISSIESVGVTVLCSSLGRVRRRVAAGFCFFVVLLIVAQKKQREHPQNAADGHSDAFTLQQKRKRSYHHAFTRYPTNNLWNKTYSWKYFDVGELRRRRTPSETGFKWLLQWNVYFRFRYL